MKSLITWNLVAGLLVALAGSAPGDTARQADVTDLKGVSVHVEGLHYCYEEAEGEALYINKYDNFFVQAGEALIQVFFENLSRIEFTSPIQSEKDLRFRQAVVLTRSGSRVETRVICHERAFIKGRTDLGEYRLDMDKIDCMVFTGEMKVDSPVFSTRLVPRAELPGGVTALTLFEDGRLSAEGSEVPAEAKALRQILSETDFKVFLKVEKGVSYSLLFKNLMLLKRAGLRELMLGP